MADIEKLDDDEVQNIVKHLLTDAYQYNTELSEDRAKATDYYFGKLFGNEEEGRSQVVLTELRDAVDGMLPSIMRIFTAGDRPVEYVPGSAETVKAVENISDYVQRKLDSSGYFLALHAAVKDGLIRRLGILKWWWNDTASTTSHELDNVTPDQLSLLASDDRVNILEVEKGSDYAEGDSVSVTFTLTKTKGCIDYAAVPPEEFLFNRNARDRNDALCVAHSVLKTRGQLIAMGLDADDVDQDGLSETSDHEFSLDAIARQGVVENSNEQSTGLMRDVKAGEANEKILYTCAYIRVDADGDGIAELRKFHCLGAKYLIVDKVRGEPAEEIPFSWFSPYPEPHSLIGQSVGDRTMDMQLYKSSIFRAMSDSLALAVFPRLLVTEGNTNIADAMNTAIGNIIRQKSIGATSSLAHDFVGREVLPILSAVDDIIERRTGMSKGAQGLDSDALQSSTQQAVGAALAMGQQQVELICRVIAEEMLKPFFRGAYKLIREYQTAPEMARLNGQWIKMNPEDWAEELDVVCNVGLGTTDSAKKVAILMAVAQDQATIFQEYGPNNPVVNLQMIRNTKAQILKYNGFLDASPYYMEVPDNWQPPAPAAPQKSPEQIQIEGELQIAQMKTDREFSMKQAELQQKQVEAEWQHQFELAKLAQDGVLRRYAIDAQFKATFSQQQMDADTQDNEMLIEGHMNAQQQTHQQAVDAHNQALAAQQQQHEQQLAQQQQAHEQQMAQQAQDTAASAATAQGGATA